jgi:hypothetical protein
MAVPTIMVQQNSQPFNDPVEGENGPVFLTDIDAVTQIIYTTLRLLLGEWWANLQIGLPLFQKLLGSSGSPQNQKACALILTQAIEACPYVLQVVSFSFTRNPNSRASTFTAIVATAFGTITVTNAPGTSATVTS